MISDVKYFENLTNAEFIGSTKDDGLEYDIYIVEDAIVLKHDTKLYFEFIKDIRENKGNKYSYTPYLSAYNYYMYDK